MSAFDQLQQHALSATRELMMAVGFAEEARDAMELDDFDPRFHTEIDSAESALITVRTQVLEMEERLGEMRAQASKGSEVAA